jgi:ATP-dependent Clp protease adaptor protein ClpS
MPNTPLCNVVFLNDDRTPMDFVVTVLQDFMGLGFDEAERLMLRVHREGRAICGTYARAEAETKAADILAFAARQGHPFQCMVEEAN